MNKFVGLSALVILLSGCGGGEEPSASEDPVAKPKANNFFAKEQQLIGDAKGIQSLLDRNADEKKKAVNAAN